MLHAGCDRVYTERHYMLTMKEHQQFRFLRICPVCEQTYDQHWKVVNHIRKTKDERHQVFLEAQEQEFFQVYTKVSRQQLHYELSILHNIFAGVSFANSHVILHRFISAEDRKQNRVQRIGQTLESQPKSAAHNLKVSAAVKQAWADGKFDTDEVKLARQIGYSHRRSFAGVNNPMFGKPSPKGAGHGKGGIRPDIGHYVRSTWEANLARIYVLVNRNYKYEATRFKLCINGQHMTYCPDFYLPDLNRYYEVKGHARSSSTWKCDCKNCLKTKRCIAALRTYGLQIRVIGHHEYKKFKRRFSSRVCWEK